MYSFHAGNVFQSEVNLVSKTTFILIFQNSPYFESLLNARHSPLACGPIEQSQIVLPASADTTTCERDFYRITDSCTIDCAQGFTLTQGGAYECTPAADPTNDPPIWQPIGSPAGCSEGMQYVLKVLCKSICAARVGQW